MPTDDVSLTIKTGKTFFEQVADVKLILEKANEQLPELHQIIPHRDVERWRHIVAVFCDSPTSGSP